LIDGATGWLKSKVGTKRQLAGNHYLIRRGSNSNDSGNDAPDEDAGGSASKAWIAGAVVGPIIGVVLIGLAVWFFRRKHAARVAAPLEPQEMHANGTPKPYIAEKVVPDPNTYHELGQSKPPNQSVQSYQRQELPADNEHAHELPANTR
jgi:hypothetical protein